MDLIQFVFDGLDWLWGDGFWTGAVIGLMMLVICLLGIWHGVRWCTVRIYNWNGQRYCYLGRAALCRSHGGYRVCLGERMADLSYTTLYQICPSRQFVRKNRYQDMVFCVGKAQSLLHVDGCMRQSVYYR